MEIGSEFSLELNSLQFSQNNLFSFLSKYKCQWFDYGRSAIKMIQVPDGKKVLLPEYICESVINCFSKNSIVFYKISSSFDIDIDDLRKKVNKSTFLIYVVNYFGSLQANETMVAIRSLCNEYSCIFLEDNTQSLFSNHLALSDYSVASIRKWMPVNQGGVLYSCLNNMPLTVQTDSIDNTRAYAMILKNLFLSRELNFNAEYRSIFRECEEDIDTLIKPKGLSQFAKFLISCIDIESLIKKRIDNTNYLQECLKKNNITPAITFKNGDCPLVLPVRVKNRDNFREYLIKNKIYCAVHWPFDGYLKTEREMAFRNSKELISLPIDQRYGMEEMDYIVDTISKYRKKIC